MTDAPAPTFPPLMEGQALDGGLDPFEKACAQALLGCDAGLVIYNLQADRLRAAIVFAPEVALEPAMAMLPACGVGFQNALGALAPPEVAVHLGWDGRIFVNGARCGRLRVAGDDVAPDAVPAWLVVGLDLPLLPGGDVPGSAPERTSLYDEGCAGVDPVHLLESWARHTLVWLNRWEDEGQAPLHAEWLGLAHGVGEEIEVDGQAGTFLGVDEHFGMLLRDSEKTRLIPLSSLVKGKSA